MTALAWSRVGDTASKSAKTLLIVVLMLGVLGVSAVAFMAFANWSRHVACGYYSWQPPAPAFWRCDLP